VEKPKGMDLFAGLGLPPQPTASISGIQPGNNPYSKSSMSEFAPMNFL
jgi:hypothetical protein